MLDMQTVMQLGRSLAVLAGKHGVDVAIAGELSVEDRVVVILTKDGETRQFEAGPGVSGPDEFMGVFYGHISELVGHTVNVPSLGYNLSELTRLPPINATPNRALN